MSWWALRTSNSRWTRQTLKPGIIRCYWDILRQLITHCYYYYIVVILMFSYCCSGFPTLPRRPLQKQKPPMRTCKQELWRRWLQQGRSYHCSHFAFSWRPPLTRWTLLSSHSRGPLREQQHTRNERASELR